jgi:hypothetical protein
MQYTIKRIKTTPKPFTKADGTAGMWNKVELQTQETGEEVLELGEGFSKSQKEKLVAGSVVIGYISKVPWHKKDGTIGGHNVKLNGITAQYVYNLLITKFPDIEKKPAVKMPGTDEDYPMPEPDADGIPW